MAFVDLEHTVSVEYSLLIRIRENYQVLAHAGETDCARETARADMYLPFSNTAYCTAVAARQLG
jgi:hypothetical protein